MSKVNCHIKVWRRLRVLMMKGNLGRNTQNLTQVLKMLHIWLSSFIHFFSCSVKQVSS